MIDPRRELMLLLGWIPVSLLGVSLLSVLAIHLVLPLLSGATILVPLLRLCQYAVPALGMFLLPVYLFPEGRRARSLLHQPLFPEGWSRRQIIRCLLVCVVGYLLCNMLTDLMTDFAERIGVEAVDRVELTVREELQRHHGTLVYYWFAFALIPAVVEELFFRGMLQPLLIRSLPIPTYASIGIASGIFALMHLSWIGFLGRIILGFLLGYLAHELRSLRLPILFHLTNNTLALVLIAFDL